MTSLGLLEPTAALRILQMLFLHYSLELAGFCLERFVTSLVISSITKENFRNVGNMRPLYERAWFLSNKSAALTFLPNVLLIRQQNQPHSRNADLTACVNEATCTRRNRGGATWVRERPQKLEAPARCPKLKVSGLGFFPSASAESSLDWRLIPGLVPFPCCITFL